MDSRGGLRLIIPIYTGATAAVTMKTMMNYDVAKIVDKGVLFCFVIPEEFAIAMMTICHMKSLERRSIWNRMGEFCLPGDVKCLPLLVRSVQAPIQDER